MAWDSHELHVSLSPVTARQPRSGPAWWVTAQGSDSPGVYGEVSWVLSESFLLKQSEKPSQLGILNAARILKNKS